MGFFSARKRTPKKVVKITNGDELMAAMSDVYSTPFGGVGQHIHYEVTPDALKQSKYWDDWELRAYIAHAVSHPRSRLDVLAVAGQAQSPVIDSGKWNYEKGEMEHPETSVNPSNRKGFPSFPAFNGWSLFFTFLLMVWVPFQWWIEARTGYKAATWLLCYPLPFFAVMVGITHLMAEWKKDD